MTSQTDQLYLHVWLVWSQCLQLCSLIKDERQQPFQEWNKPPELHHPVPSKIKPIHVLLMHTPLVQKVDRVPTPDPTLEPTERHLLMDLLRDSTFARTFLWFMLSLQHWLSSDKSNHLSDMEGLRVSEYKKNPHAETLHNLIKYFPRVVVEPDVCVRAPSLLAQSFF